MVELGPSVVPCDTELPFEIGRLCASELRALTAEYGNPPPACAWPRIGTALRKL
jgi:hypothetical protein